MNDAAREALCAIVRKKGQEILEDPRRCEAMLHDLCGTFRPEINCLVAALKSRIPQEILNSPTVVPYGMLEARLVSKFLEEQPVTEETAQWVVRAWGYALGRKALPSVKPAWSWQSGQKARSYTEWLEQAQQPLNRSQAEAAIGKGELQAWLLNLEDTTALQQLHTVTTLDQLLPSKSPSLDWEKLRKCGRGGWSLGSRVGLLVGPLLSSWGLLTTGKKWDAYCYLLAPVAGLCSGYCIGGIIGTLTALIGAYCPNGTSVNDSGRRPEKKG